jgi:hypothetical protein
LAASPLDRFASTLHGLRAPALAAAALLLGGCGLSDYEAKLASEQKRVDRLDEENMLLGEPLDLPPQKSREATTPLGTPTLDVFFRPPRGINTKYDPTPLGELLYRYTRAAPRGGARRYSPGYVDPADNPFLEVDLAVTPEGNWKEFTDKVQQPFQGMAAAEPIPPLKEPAGKKRLDFQSVAFNDAGNPPATYLVFFHKGQHALVAIVYRVSQSKATDPEVAKTIDVSLKTLAVGPEATQLRQRYGPRK